MAPVAAQQPGAPPASLRCVSGNLRPRHLPPPSTRAGLASISKVEITRLNFYEFQVVVHTLSSLQPFVLWCRCDTWRALHTWVNGLTMLSSLARSGFFAALDASSRAD